MQLQSKTRGKMSGPELHGKKVSFLIVNCLSLYLRLLFGFYGLFLGLVIGFYRIIVPVDCL
jgi:hypothetical protein